MKTVVYLSKVDQIAIIDPADFDSIEVGTVDYELFYDVYHSYNDLIEDAKKHVLGDL
jgi:hypothetical protein